MKRPFAPVALIYVAGVLTATRVNLPLIWLLLLSLGLAGIALTVDSKRTWFLWPLIFFTGWVGLASRTEIISPRDLRVLIEQRTELVALRGILAETPSERLQLRDDEERWRSLAPIDVSELRRGAKWQPAFGRVMATLPDLLPKEFCRGQIVEVTGVLRPPNGPLADGLFDYRTYLRWQGIYYEFATETTNDWKNLSAANPPSQLPLADRFQSWAKRCLARGLPVEDEELRLLKAMTLGWQAALTNEVSEPFMRSGTMHIFAISGLHIALIAGIFVQLLRLVQVPRAWCGAIVIPLIWFYTGATGWQASAIRSTIMMTIVIGGWSLNRPGDLLNSLSAAGFIILIWEPRQLFQAGFQLSFFVVLSIALLLPPIEKLRQRLLQTDPLLPADLRPRWQRWLDLPVRWVTMSLATSLAAWLGSMPLIAYYFHLFTPVSLLANLVIVPLSSLALMCNLGALVCGDWLPFFTEWFNHSAWLWMHLMVKLSEWSVTWPGSFFYIRAPSGLEFWIYYTALFAALNGWFIMPRIRAWAISSLAILLALWSLQQFQERHTTRVTVLPLSGGHAVYIEAAGRQSELLVDCGNELSANAVTKLFLRAQGVNRLRNFLLTHGDTRHIGGAELIANNFAARQIFTSSASQRSTAYREVIERLAATPERWQQVNRGDRVAGWQVLHPDSQDKFSQADDASLVLFNTILGAKILLLADLGKPGQTALLAREPQLKADVVVTGLPAQNEPVIDAFLDVVQPRLLIVCTSLKPAMERPSAKLRARLHQRGVTTVYTHETGAVTLTLRPGSRELKTASPFAVGARF
ncbi:MAG: ComEC/Rec2 family competence protein [Verrucomicrobia bacterium]|nr:ComEC/Rec2 family competence protein [Verrucomicrobiota bacterium]